MCKCMGSEFLVKLTIQLTPPLYKSHKLQKLTSSKSYFYKKLNNCNKKQIFLQKQYKPVYKNKSVIHKSPKGYKIWTYHFIFNFV